MPGSAELPSDWLQPDWRVAAHVRGLVTTRAGGVSPPPYASLNLGHGPRDGRVHDEALAVDVNRARVGAHLPAPPVWLRQVHGIRVLDVDTAAPAAQGRAASTPEADAAVTRRRGVPLVVLVADCLPVLLAAEDGSVIGIAHAGWRGLAAGVIEATLAAMRCPGGSVRAWLGPCIGPQAFEVGADVRDAFASTDAAALAHFAPLRDGKWLADLPALARERLHAAGVAQVRGGTWCTARDPARFYSYRRDGETGRMGAFLWLEPHA